MFNLCEAIDGVAALEPAVISVLELLGLPFTRQLELDDVALPAQARRQRGARAGGTARSRSSPSSGAASAIPSVGFPAICKPAAEDASIGVEQRSVVRNIARSSPSASSAMLERWDEVLVQRYVEGREVNVGILGDAVLPIAEIDFGRMPKGMWRIVTYRSKWEDGSRRGPRRRAALPGAAAGEVAAQLRKIAVAAWRIVGGSGYGRVDMRIDERGRPWILEVNANPDIAPDAGLARMARVAGIDYGALVRQDLRARTAARARADVHRRAMGARAAAVGCRAGESRSRISSRRARRSVSIRLGALRPRDRARVAELLDVHGSLLATRRSTSRSSCSTRAWPTTAPAGADDAHVAGLRVRRRVRRRATARLRLLRPDAGNGRNVRSVLARGGSAAVRARESARRSFAKWSAAARAGRETVARGDVVASRLFEHPSVLRPVRLHRGRPHPDFYAPADDRIMLTTRLTTRERGAATR